MVNGWVEPNPSLQSMNLRTCGNVKKIYKFHLWHQTVTNWITSEDAAFIILFTSFPFKNTFTTPPIRYISGFLYWKCDVIVDRTPLPCHKLSPFLQPLLSFQASLTLRWHWNSVTNIIIIVLATSTSDKLLLKIIDKEDFSSSSSIWSQQLIRKHKIKSAIDIWSTYLLNYLLTGTYEPSALVHHKTINMVPAETVHYFLWHCSLVYIWTCQYAAKELYSALYRPVVLRSLYCMDHICIFNNVCSPSVRKWWLPLLLVGGFSAY